MAPGDYVVEIGSVTVTPKVYGTGDVVPGGASTAIVMFDLSWLSPFPS